MTNQALSRTLRRLIMGMKHHVLRDLRDANLALNPPDVLLLEQLAEQPGLNPLALTKLNGCDKALITRRVRSLEARGWIKREPDPQDQRSVQLSLTRQGAQVKDQALAIFYEAETAAFAPLSDAERETLLALLSKCLPAD
ncbi:MarR family winged helix-turn-helix transcriptional regulator [Pseudomonas segetis]|uniref:MarR family transcriptional regulator, repressor of the mexAB-oprM multidrug resistance operon n=1 Tax=Pseudomonas segetis TaxID=298908 RepID=A0A239I9H9_9PSED|nr:MarR family transcriptional regulator, repressor of the mexAB-oprM multidrug resistance operon [Pseudomonas segetis]